MNKAICAVSVAPIRAQNSHQSEMTSQLLYGESLEIIEVEGSFSKIKMDFDQSWSCVMINDQKGKILLKNTQSAFELVRTQLNDIKQ